MPKDAYGNPADVIGDPTSTVSRMNLARLYNQYFGGISRKMKYGVIDMLGMKNSDLDPLELVYTTNNNTINKIFDHMLGLLEIIGTEQYTNYRKISDIEVKKDIIYETVTKEFYIYYKVSSKKAAYQIVAEIKDSIYAPLTTNIEIDVDGVKKESIDEVLIAPMYMILLNKNAENFLSAASSKVNHYGFPVGVSKFERGNVNYNKSAVRVYGETEVRMLAAYGGRKLIAELKDRASSQETHKYMYEKLLNVETPTNLESVIDRTERPYGDDAGLKLVESIFNAAGIDIVYTEEEKR